MPDLTEYPEGASLKRIEGIDLKKVNAVIAVKEGWGYAVVVRSEKHYWIDFYSGGDSVGDSKTFGTGELPEPKLLEYAMQMANERLAEINCADAPISRHDALVEIACMETNEIDQFHDLWPEFRKYVNRFPEGWPEEQIVRDRPGRRGCRDKSRCERGTVAFYAERNKRRRGRKGNSVIRAPPMLV